MSTIHCIYHPVDGKPQEPPFAAKSQQPDAQRYLVGKHYVDASGGAPTQAEVDAVLAPPKADTAAAEAAIDAEGGSLAGMRSLLKKLVKGELKWDLYT